MAPWCRGSLATRSCSSACACWLMRRASTASRPLPSASRTPTPWRCCGRSACSTSRVTSSTNPRKSYCAPSVKRLERESQSQIKTLEVHVLLVPLVVALEHQVSPDVEVRAERPDAVVVLWPQAVIAGRRRQRHLPDGQHRSARALVTCPHVVDLVARE